MVLDYSTWRWRALQSDRTFLMVNMNMMASFGWWMGAMYSQHSEVYYQSYGKNHNSHLYEQPLFPVSFPPLMGGIHCVIAMFLCFPKYGFMMRHGTQGLILCRFIGISTMGCILYMLYSWYRQPEQIYFDNSDVVFAFSVLQFSVSYSVTGMGLPSIEMWYIRYFSLLFWLVASYLSKESFSGPIELLCILIASYMVTMTEVCHEADLRKKFVQVSQLTRMMGSKFKSTDGSNNSGSFSGDAVYNPHVPNFLKTIQKRVEELERILTIRGIEENILIRDRSGYVIGRRYERRYSKLFEVRQLCRSLRGILTSENKMFTGRNELYECQFAFSKLCMTTFALVESSRGRGHALFTCDDIPEVYVKGPERFIRMILYLLIVDAIDMDPVYSPGIVAVKCLTVQGRWNIVVSVTRVVQKQVADETSGAIVDDSEGADGDDTSNSNSTSGAGRGEDAGDLTETLRELLANRGHSTPDLAAGLAARYLDTKIEMKEETGENNMFRQSTYSFVVPGLVSQVIGVEAHSDHLLVHQSWLLLTWRNPNARDIFEHYQIAQQLKTLGVPFETCKVSRSLESWHKKHNVVVISEANLNFNHTILVPLLQRVACEVIVLSDHILVSPEHFYKTFGLRVRIINGDSTINELLPYVTAFYSEMEPRILTTKA